MASISKRPDGRWRARYRDEAGREHSQHFERKVDGQSWLDQVTAAVVIGQYVDPKAGRITFTDFYGQWSRRQVWVAGTRRSMDITARSVTFGGVPLRSLRRSHVEGWVKSMSSRGWLRRRLPLAPTTSGPSYAEPSQIGLSLSTRARA